MFEQRIDTFDRWKGLTPEQIIQKQEKKLRDFIRYQLYPFSPHYHKLFNEHGIDPESINTIKDLEKIPLTKKEDIVPTKSNPKKWKDFILQPDKEKIKKYWPKTKLMRLVLQSKTTGKSMEDILINEYYPTTIIATSGTTGNNVPFVYTNWDLKLFTDSYIEMGHTTGLKPDEVALSVFPFAPHLAFTFVYLANVNGPWRVLHSGGGAVTSSSKTLDIAERIEANIILGIPSYVYHVLRMGSEDDRDYSKIHGVLTAGEKMTQGTKTKIKGMLKKGGAKNPKILDIYGTTEMRAAYAECETDLGEYHSFPNLHIVEIVDPETGKQKKEGESGAIAVTNIDGRGSVVCRYLIGDIFEGGLIRNKKCKYCGSTAPRLVGPIGRMRDYSATMDLTKIKGTLVNMNIVYDILSDHPDVEEWQVVLGKKDNDPHSMDEFKIKVAPSTTADHEELAKEIKTKVNDAIEVNPKVSTDHTPEELFEALGGSIKAKRFLDERALLEEEAEKDQEEE